MRYYLYGPMELPRGDDNLLNFTEYDRATMWADLEAREALGLADACGCYVFGIRAGRGVRPWYVGKAEKQSFKRECLTDDKLRKYNSVLLSASKGTPVIYFYARTTMKKHAWSAPSKSRHMDIDYLERMLIGLALDKNKNLVNVKETGLLRNMIVPGLLNTPRGALTRQARELKKVMGY